jgi:hypothetical protein
VACVLATQGLADLARVDRALPQQVVQDTAVKVLLRQGSGDDALAWARHPGQYEREELSRHLDRGLFRGLGDTGRATTRWRRDVYVSPDELRALGTGEAVVAVAPIGRQPRRLERGRVARPGPPGSSSQPPPAGSSRTRLWDRPPRRPGELG